MSSIVETEAWRVSEILGTAARQLELMAMVPRGKRLATVAATSGDRAVSTTSTHAGGGGSKTPSRASAVGGELDASLVEALRVLAAAETVAERRRKEAMGDATPGAAASSASVWAASKRLARILDLAASKAAPGRGEADGDAAVPTLEALRSRLSARRAKESKPGALVGGRGAGSRSGVGKSNAAGTFEPSADTGRDSGAESESKDVAGGLLEFPMESMASLIGALQLGLRARMRTNAEQEAIRLEFERTVSDRIRESRARESLLLDEKRRMEMRHKDEEDRLSETLSKLKLELKDLQAAEERRRSALQAAVDRRETELAAAADDAQHSLHDALAAAKSGLAEDGAKHVADEARLRKLRNYQARDLGDRLKQYDTEMSKLQARADKLTADNKELETHCSALQAHLDMLDQNRRLAQEQKDEVLTRRGEDAKMRVQTQLPAVRRIVRWYRSLKSKREAERKASKGKKKK